MRLNFALFPIFLYMPFYRLLALLLILTIHFLFTHKYLARVTDWVWLIDVFYAGFYTLLVLKFKSLPRFLYKKWILYAALTALLIAHIFLFIKIPQQSLNVDRWSVISSFWDAALAGEYPYAAKSHMDNMPGPSPFYFLLALPFYLTGELGFLSITGFLLLIFLAFRYYKNNNQAIILAYFALFSIPLQYEIVTRSTILFNTVIVLVFMLISWETRKWNLKKVLITGLFGGLILSTRSVMVLPLIFLYVYLLKYMMGWKYVWALGVSTVTGFLILLLPLYFWNPELFWQFNPIALQKSFIPNSLLALLLIGSVVWAFQVNKKEHVILGSGMMLFMAVAFHFAYLWVKYDFQDVYFNSSVDISYFVLSLPFLLLYLQERKLTTP